MKQTVGTLLISAFFVVPSSSAKGSPGTGFSHKDGAFTLVDFGLKPEDHYFSVPYGINDAGVIAGAYYPISLW